MAGKCIRFLHRLLTFAETLLLVLAILYAGYALWDNAQVYNQVENAMGEMREIKALAGDEPLSMFDQLRVINRDVRAWVTMDNTAIDYPVLQGRSNFSYINTDVYGNFALLGSIFLDYRNAGDFSDPYSLLYGHDITGHRMFSDVNLYKDEAFFRANTAGTLSLPDGVHPLLTLSCLVTGSGDSLIFNPVNWRAMTPEQILQAVRKEAMYVNTDGIRVLEAMIEAGMEIHIVTLSTCSSEYTDARTVLMTLMDPITVRAGFMINQTGECME